MAKATDGGSLVQEIKDLEQSGSWTDRSGTTNAGSDTVTSAIANPARSFLFVQNVSGTDKWIDFGTAAVPDKPSIKLTPNTSIMFQFPGFVPTGALHIYCAVAESYTVKEF
jgi:hypothetical protein